MNILFLTPVVPTQTDGRRPYNLIKYLVRRHNVHLIALRMPVQSDADVRQLQSMGVHVHAIIDYPKWKSMLQCVLGLLVFRSLRVSCCQARPVRTAIQDLLRQAAIDVVHIDRMRMGRYARMFEQPVVVDFTDSLPLYLRRSMRYRTRWLDWLVDRWELATIPNEERRLHRLIRQGLVCSPLDAEEYRRNDPTAQMTVLENAVDVDQFAPRHHPAPHSPRLILTGTLFYFPNIDSVRFYLHDILPGLRAAFPSIETHIIGTRPESWIRALDGYQGIRVFPDVPRMEEHLYSDDIYLCPLRVAAGVRNKLLEAMACMMPVVTTRLGAEGLSVEEGQEMLFAETPDEFVEKVRWLIQNPKEGEALGKAGRSYVKHHHTIDVLGRTLVDMYTDLLRK